MNSNLEHQIKDLIKDAERDGAAAVYTVLHLLLASHLEGVHHKFAQHCCQFSPIDSVDVNVQNPDSEDFWPTSLNSSKYYN